jgi:hypothetical protein
MDRFYEFRKAAADCVALARMTSDPKTRASLLTMAQKWYDLANGPPTNFEAILREFNDEQMSRPVTQPPAGRWRASSDNPLGQR